MTTRNKDICLAWISPGVVSHKFCSSLMHMLRAHSEKGRKVIRSTIDIESGPRIADTRGQIVEHFMNDRATNWLLMIDTDMVFTVEDVDRLIDAADEKTAPVVGGLCFGGRGEPNPIFPTLYSLGRNPNGQLVTNNVWEYPDDALIDIDATGAAFLLIHRSVFTKLKREFGVLPNGEDAKNPWFAEANMGDTIFGEDISFCIKVRSMDIPIKVHTGVKIGHVKTHVLGEAQYYAQQHDHDQRVQQQNPPTAYR